MMKRFFTQNTPFTGLVGGLGSLLATAILLTIGLMIAGEPVEAHLSWYAGCFIVPLLIMRYYVKLQLSTVVKTIIVILFFTFIPFIFFLFKTHSLNF